MSRRHLWSAYIGVVAAATAVYALHAAPAVRDAAWMVIACGPVAAIVGGIVVHRPAARGPWWLTAAGLSVSAVAWVVEPSTQDLASTSVRGAAADVLHLCGYLTIGGAVLWFVRLQTPDRDRESVIDGVIVAVALATVLWSVVIDPWALGADASAPGRIVYIVAPILPALVTAVCVRLLFVAGGRLASARLLGGAWMLAFVGTIGWIMMLQAGAFVPGGWTNLVWAAALGCAGASALHPSMVEMSRRTAATHRTVSTARLTVLGFALLATPGALLPAAGTTDVSVVLPVAGAGAIALLVLARLARLVHEREQARAALEIRAAQHGVVARLGEAALGEEPIDALYAEAAGLLAGVLDGVRVTIGSADAGSSTGEPASTVLSLPISGAGSSGANLDVTAEPGRALSVDERALLASVTAVLSGMTARRQAEEDLRRRALHDDLTGLPNRVLVLERLAQAISPRERGPVGVLFVDLDGFKLVNDEHGHEVGDMLLIHLASRMSEALRLGDTVGRLAGDEFVVVAPDCDEAGLEDLAGRLLCTLSAPVEPVEAGGPVLSVAASVGAALATAADRDPQEVLRRADAAMYAAKAAGGGTVAALSGLRGEPLRGEVRAG